MNDHLHRHASYLDVMRQIVKLASRMPPRMRRLAAREAAVHHDEPCEHCWLNARQTEAHALEEVEEVFLAIPESRDDEFKELRRAVEAKSIIYKNCACPCGCSGYQEDWGLGDDTEGMLDKMAEMAAEFGLPAYNPHLSARYQQPLDERV